MGTRAHTVPRFYLGGFVAPESDAYQDPFVWVGSLTTGDIIRQSPKNISIVPGLYDGPGALTGPGASIEAHLSKIESAAAVAIRKLSATPSADGDVGPPEIWPFLAWQAARTPGWMELEQQWINDPPFNLEAEVVEPPPPGIEGFGDRVRPHCLEDQNTGTRREVIDAEEFAAYRKQGWKWVLTRDDPLEMMYMQAWYFQVRHFRRLSWVRLDAPDGEWFITSDRGVAWVVDGLPDTPPAALRHPTAQVVAPLTRKIALVGRHGTHRLQVTPREVNRFVAFAASDWIVGPTRGVVETALIDRERVITLDRNVGTSSRII
ncbi:MAG: DUF4238 domain-containing protein [Acidobacteriota bacterium]